MQSCTRAGSPSIPSAEGAGPTRPQRFPSSRQIHWFVHQRTEKPDFPAVVLFTDDSYFTREGIFNRHNSHVWAEANPHVASVDLHQQRFVFNVWEGIFSDSLIGPYLLPQQLSAQIYRVFLEERYRKCWRKSRCPSGETCGSNTTGLQLTLHVRLENM